MGTFKHCTIHAAIYLLRAHMHDLIGLVLLMVCTTSKLYLTSTEWSLYLLQMKITGLHIVDLEYVQIRSLGKLLRVVQFRPKSETKWMRLILSNQSVVAGVGKRVIPAEDAQPYVLHPPTRLVKIISFVCL